MRTQPTLALVVSTMLLGAAATQAQPAETMTGREDILTSTEDWTDADTNDDGTLSQAELNRAEPTLAAYFREIDVDGDRRLSRDEIAAWQADPDPGEVDADELPAGAVDRGAVERSDADTAVEDQAASPDPDQGSVRNRSTDDLLPDDGDESSELLPDDANDDTTEAGEVEPDSGRQ
jgi:hypothetical protein